MQGQYPLTRVACVCVCVCEQSLVFVVVIVSEQDCIFTILARVSLKMLSSNKFHAEKKNMTTSNKEFHFWTIEAVLSEWYVIRVTFPR